MFESVVIPFVSVLISLYLAQDFSTACTGFTYYPDQDCLAALAREAGQPNCGSVDIEYERRRCELRAPEDLVALRRFTRILTPKPVVRLSNHNPCQVWNKITYPFRNFNGVNFGYG